MITPNFKADIQTAIDAFQVVQLAIAEYALHTDKPHYSIVECADRLDEAERALASIKGAL